jgi:hypothetical protein
MITDDWLRIPEMHPLVMITPNDGQGAMGFPFCVEICAFQECGSQISL